MICPVKAGLAAGGGNCLTPVNLVATSSVADIASHWRRYASMRRKTSVQFCPPKAKELTSAARTGSRRAAWGT